MLLMVETSRIIVDSSTRAIIVADNKMAPVRCQCLYRIKECTSSSSITITRITTTTTTTSTEIMECHRSRITLTSHPNSSWVTHSRTRWRTTVAGMEIICRWVDMEEAVATTVEVLHRDRSGDHLTLDICSEHRVTRLNARSLTANNQTHSSLIKKESSKVPAKRKASCDLRRTISMKE